MSQPDAPVARALVRDVLDTARTVTVALGVSLLLRVVLFQPVTIPSESMEPGLLVGDYVVVTKFDYGWSRFSLPFSPRLPGGRVAPRPVARGDVVVFKKPGEEAKEDVIKRVVGLPGDRGQVVDGAVRINGRPASRSAPAPDVDPGEVPLPVLRRTEVLGAHAFAMLDRGPGHEGDDTGVYVVPAGCYFVMGDNRDNSADSRWPRGVGMGFVPAENVIGRARFILLSWRPGASLFKPWTWPNLRVGRTLRPLP